MKRRRRKKNPDAWLWLGLAVAALGGVAIYATYANSASMKASEQDALTRAGLGTGTTPTPTQIT